MGVEVLAPSPLPAPHNFPNIDYDYIQATAAAVVATTEAVCDLPDMHSIAHDGFNCKFHKYGVEGHMGKMGAEIPAGAWPPGDNRVPHIVVSGVKYTKLSAWGTWKVLAGSGLTMHDEQVYETQDHHVKAAGDIEGMEIAGVIIEFLPSPVSFLKPVTLHMPAYDLDGELAKGREFSVAQFDPKQNKWVLKPVSKGVEVIVNGTITGETNSFSLYAAVSFPPQESHCKRNLGMCVSMSVLGSIIGAALAALALGMLCCRKAGDDSVVLEDEMDVLHYYFALWSNAVDEVKNGPSLGTLTMRARGKLGGGAMAGGGLMGGRSVGGAMNGMNATVSTSLGALQTSTSMGKRLEVSRKWRSHLLLSVHSPCRSLCLCLSQLCKHVPTVKTRRCHYPLRSSCTKQALIWMAWSRDSASASRRTHP